MAGAAGFEPASPALETGSLAFSLRPRKTLSIVKEPLSAWAAHKIKNPPVRAGLETMKIASDP
jgi:hypothetical protein